LQPRMRAVLISRVVILSVNPLSAVSMATERVGTAVVTNLDSSIAIRHKDRRRIYEILLAEDSHRRIPRIVLMAAVSMNGRVYTIESAPEIGHFKLARHLP
jgi:hypothetical protein